MIKDRLDKGILMAINDSLFNMWRAVIAIVHADTKVQPHEINFILQNIKGLALSDEQRDILFADMRTPYDAEAAFCRISSPAHKESFFHLARAIAWSDGDLDDREDALIARIRALPSDKNDVSMMEEALSHFREIYVEGASEKKDVSLFSMVQSLISRRSA
ncbi:MAG: hypothetical protein DI551_09260 [Micavibrio aeruginosavorus]|uniref:Co-chaperone DjlA N-terminal domain-containing protein n=1 Tax=Micavibrio aeruginosavorus TaxID=349221 RepID=A0A2W5MVL8_9BACT|nr:MAG: hypothetical protein DI551_09260 [Micavibrio aeruginosavorus]